MSNYDYLSELRRRAWHTVLTLLAVFSILVIYSRQIFDEFIQILYAKTQTTPQLIATEVVTPFTIPLKFAFITSFLICIPFLIWQIWRFISPGLFAKERKWLIRLLCLSLALFYTGAFFAFHFVLPTALGFFYNASPTNVIPMTDIQALISFCFDVMFAFAIAFETPIVTFLLIRWGIVSAEQLEKKRSYVIVGAFTLGMILTPPDVISQTLLAIPLWLLFESGVLLAKWWR